jgi:hypothetical protein
VTAGEQPASVAEEARRLLDALDERVPGWLREDVGASLQAAAVALGASAEHVRHAVDESLATGSAECRLCPVCRLIALIRDRDDPETRRLIETLGTLGAGLLGLLDSVLDDRRRHATRPPGDVEHIDID